MVQLQLSRFFYQKVTKKAILLVIMNDIGIGKSHQGAIPLQWKTILM